MALGVRILSVNLSGLTTNVTYLPDSGGTIDLGSQVFPFNYISDYYWGTYNCYVPTYGYTYSIEVAGPTPTPTSSETPTPTPTETETPTPTPTNTETPVVTPSPTETETPTPTSTETPTNTPTPTNTETPTQTPTETETPTPTPTETPTNTPTPTQIRFSFLVGSGSTLSEACASPTVGTIWGDSPLFDGSIQFYPESSGPSTMLPGFYSNLNTATEIDSDGAQVGAYQLCTTQTPTPTNTETPTPTPTSP